MDDNTSADTADGPWYRVRLGQDEVAILLDADEEPAAVCNVDVEVRTADGARWAATVFTLAEVERLMARWSRTGEALNGRYFWCSDGLIVRDPGVDSIIQVITGLLGSGEFSSIFQRLDES